MATTVSIKTLLDAGVHFGHQTRRWNPKMEPYIFGKRNGIHILDLKKTLYAIDDAYSVIKDLSARGKKVLFVGTKKQAQEPIKEQAQRCGMPYVNYRWMGGMMTNFQTIRKRVKYMEEIEEKKLNGDIDSYTKKEQIMLNKEHAKLELALGGIREMYDLPAAIFVVDTKHEINAVCEANRLNIPIIGLLDTNADPDNIDYGIPANDDAIRSIELMCTLVADAVLAGANADVSVEEMSAQAPEQAAQEAAADAASVADAAVAEVVAEDAVAEAAAAAEATTEA